MSTGGHALYRFYDHFGALLYVGITVNPPQRFRAHQGGKLWWSEVAGIRLEHHHSRDSVIEAERQAITHEKPRYNIRHNDNVASVAARPARPEYVLVEYESPEREWTPAERAADRAAADVIGRILYGATA